MKKIGIGVCIEFDNANRLFPLYVFDGDVNRLRRVNDLLSLARRQVQSGDINAAIRLMRYADYLVPGDPKLFNVCATIFFVSARYEEMAECLHCAIGLSSKNCYLYIHRAWALACSGDFDEARKNARTAQRLSEGMKAEAVYCYRLSGIIELMDKKYWQAAVAFLMASLADPLSENYEECSTLATMLKQRVEAGAMEVEVEVCL